MSQACEAHAKVPVKGYSACAGCEIESLQQLLNARDDEVESLRAQLAEAHALLEDCTSPVRDAENNADCVANERLYHNLGNAIRSALSDSAGPEVKS